MLFFFRIFDMVMDALCAALYAMERETLHNFNGFAPIFATYGDKVL